MTPPHTEDDDDTIPRQRGDRRHWSTTEVISVAMLLLQFAAIVWGASQLKASVDGLQTTMVEMSRQVKESQATVNELSIDVGILKDRSSKK